MSWRPDAAPIARITRDFGIRINIRAPCTYKYTYLVLHDRDCLHDVSSGKIVLFPLCFAPSHLSSVTVFPLFMSLSLSRGKRHAFPVCRFPPQFHTAAHALMTLCEQTRMNREGAGAVNSKLLLLYFSLSLSSLSFPFSLPSLSLPNLSSDGKSAFPRHGRGKRGRGKEGVQEW